MPLINKLESNHIAGLDPAKLTQLLDRLLKLEAERYKFKNYNIYVPDKITKADAGKDGGITCSDTNGSRWIDNTNILFQNKKSNLTPAKCKTELLANDLPLIRKFKKQVEKVLDAGGKYILFMGYHPGSEQDLDDRIDAFYNKCIELKKSYRKDQFAVYDAKKIADWASEYPETIIWVQEKVGITRISGLMTISEWAHYSVIYKNEFYSTDFIKQTQEGILEQLRRKRACIRVIGHSGLGKTRLVYECLKSIDLARESIVYYNVSSNSEAILQFVKTNNGNLSGILVADNCGSDLHQKLKDEVLRQNSSFKLITIDYNVEEQFDKNSQVPDTAYFFIESKHYQDVVLKILNTNYSGLDPKQLEQIAEYSEGYPIMAVFFAEAKLKGTENLAEVFNKDIQERLVFGRDYEQREQHAEKYRVLQACAIFKEFAYPFDDVDDLYSFNPDLVSKIKAQAEFIFKDICDPSVHANNFKAACEYFSSKGIMERRGWSYSVKPNPLAIKLALDWWNSLYDKTRLGALLPGFENVGLSVNFIERFKYLGQLAGAKKIIEDYWGDKGPFGKAEVLNTDLGSRLFRSVVEVNPGATVRTLTNNYLALIKTEIMQIKQGRRNLVWALEKLCFRKETFLDAAKVLMVFAVGENENISNNATQQFLQLFNVYLAGTESSLLERIDVIRYGLSKDEDYQRLAILAMGKAIRNASYSRMGGAEKQGGEVLKDYQPKRDEIVEYRIAIFNLMLETARNQPHLIPLIKEHMVGGAAPLINAGYFDIVDKTFKEIYNLSPGLWELAYDNLTWSLNHDRFKPEIKDKVAKLIDDITPKDLGNQIKVIVSLPPYQSTVDENGETISLTAVNAEKFGEKCAEEPDKIIPYLDQLLSGEQRQAFIFARALGKKVVNVNHLVDAVLNALRAMDKNVQNVDLLAGLMLDATDTEKKDLLAVIRSDARLAHQSFYLTRVWILDKETLYPLIDLVKNGIAEPDYFLNLSWGYTLDRLDAETRKEFYRKLYHTNDRCKKIAFSLLHDHSYKDVNQFLDVAREFIVNHNYLSDKERTRFNTVYQWADFIEKLFAAERDEDLAAKVSGQLFEALASDDFDTLNGSLRHLAKELITNYFDQFFNAISGGLTDTGSAYFHIRYFLGSSHGFGGSIEDKGILFCNEAGNEKIFDFCMQKRANVVLSIGNMMPIYIRKETGLEVWHPFALKMIEEFCDEPHFLSEVDANMHSFGSVGTNIPYYRMLIKLMKELLANKKITLRKWAEKNIESLDRTIKRERIEDEQRYFGTF